MNSTELAEKISEYHLRKATLVVEVKTLENALQIPDSEERKAKVQTLNTTIGELAGINETLKAYNSLYRNCTDQLMLKTLQREYPEIYKRVENIHRRNRLVPS